MEHDLQIHPRLAAPWPRSQHHSSSCRNRVKAKIFSTAHYHTPRISLGTQIKRHQTEADTTTHTITLHAKNLPYLPESAQHSDCKHNKGWKINFRTEYLPVYFPATIKYLPASNKKRRTTDIHKISVVRLIIYSYSECLFLKVKLTWPPQRLLPLNIKELYLYGTNMYAYYNR